MFPGVTDLLPQRGDTAFEGERAHRHPPSVAGLTDDEVSVGAGVGEEDFVELGVSGQLDDRADLDARLIQRDQQIGQTGVPLGALLAARHDETPLRPVRQRGPDLLAIDDPVPTLFVEHRGGCDVGEVAARAGLGIAL